MNWTKLACVLVVAGGLVVVGCGDDADSGTGTGDTDAGDPGGDTDGGIDPGDEDSGTTPEPGGDTYAYVVSALDVGRDVEGVAPGFNLDGVNSQQDGDPADYTAGCEWNDSTSPDGEEGIDNRLGVITPDLEETLEVDIASEAQMSINDGSLVFLIEVANVNDLAEDDLVTVSFYFGEVEGGGMPMLSGDMLAGGQTFTIDPMFLNSDGSPLVQLDGVIENGVVKVGPVPELPIQITLGDVDDDGMPDPISLDVLNASLTFGVSETAMSDGVLGGALNVQDVITQVEMLSDEIPRDTLQQILGAQADIDPVDGVCEAMSAALVFEGVDAMLAE